MDPVRFGLSIRALRRRRGWTQAELGHRARASRSAISRVERGEGDRLSARALARITDALGARLLVRVLWQGEELDRLLDAAHARLVEVVLLRLAAAGWLALPEVTFQVERERGSMDILAWHARTASLLVVEVKSVVPDVQATLAGIDRKARLAPTITRDRGWAAGSVSRLLVLPDDRTARRRVDAFAATFGRALPARTIAVRRWLRSPTGSIAGVLFVSDAPQAGTRHRVRGGLTRGERGLAAGS
jgi:transcriptional regulator with XRE-family HTH domain